MSPSVVERESNLKPGDDSQIEEQGAVTQWGPDPAYLARLIMFRLSAGFEPKDLRAKQSPQPLNIKIVIYCNCYTGGHERKSGAIYTRSERPRSSS